MFFAALLFCDENPREHQVRSQPGIWEKTGLLQFRMRSLHAAKTLVQLIANRFRTRPVDQQVIARLCFFYRSSTKLRLPREPQLRVYRQPVLKLVL